MSRVIKPGARNQAVDETRMTFITVHEHILGKGTKSTLTVFRWLNKSYKILQLVFCVCVCVCVCADCTPHCYRVVGPATHFLFVLCRMFTYRNSRFIRRIFPGECHQKSPCVFTAVGDLLHKQISKFEKNVLWLYEEVLISLSPTRKETSYSDQTRDLFNILPTKLNTFLGPLL
jgi:hypothetical protein